MSVGNRLYTATCFVIFAVLVLAASSQTNAEIIHESATMGPAGQYSGYEISEDQFIGSRFYVSETSEVTAIGGHFVEYNSLHIFGAIVTLNDQSDLPSGSPFWTQEVFAWTYFTTPWNSSDIRIPLNVTLQPGWYGLIFGAGEFTLSRNAISLMPGGGQTAMAGSSFFVWDSMWQMWFNTTFPSDPPRFVVESIPAVPPTEIHGNKFNDADGNGNWDDGEPAIGGWEFYLDLNTNGILDAGEPNAIADPNGCYEFLDLDPGTYTVAEVMRDGWVQTLPGGAGSYSLVMDVNDVRTDINFGNTRPQPGDITGMKFHDTNGNGIEEPGEPALSGFEIYLDVNSDNKFNSGEPRTTTDAQGNYAFRNVQPGRYTVREIPRAGWAQTLPGETGGKIYACEYLGIPNKTNIHVIDPADGTILNTFTIPTGLVVLRGGNIAVGPVSIFFVALDFDQDGLFTDIWEIEGQTGAVIDHDTIRIEDGLIPTGAAYLNGKLYITNTIFPTPDPPLSTLMRYNPVTDQVETVLTLDRAGVDALSAKPEEGVLLWPAGVVGLDKLAKVDPDTGEIVGFIEHERYPAPLACYLDGYIYRSFWSDPFTTYVIDAATGQLERTFEITGPADISGTGADGLGNQEYNVTLTSGDINGLDFGNTHTATASITGRIYNDTNHNGRIDAEEETLPGKELYLDIDNNGLWSSGEPTATTNPSGLYAFENLTADTYIVRSMPECNFKHTFPRTVKSKMINVDGPREVLFDDSRGLLYVGTSDGTLLRYNPAAETFLAPVAVGNKLNGMDITPGGQFLYITEGAPSGPGGIVHKVNLDTLAVANIAYTLEMYETGGWDIKVLSSRKAFFTATYSGSAGQFLRQIDMATDTVTKRTDIPGASFDEIDDDSRLFRSDDRSFMLIVGSTSAGYVVEYHTDTDTFGPHYNRQEYLHKATFDCGTDASIIASTNHYGGVKLYSRGFEPIMPFHGGEGGLLVLDQENNMLYYDHNNVLHAIDLTTYNAVNWYGLGYLPPYKPFETGECAKSGDGRFIALTGKHDDGDPAGFEGIHLITAGTAHEVGLTPGRIISDIDFALAEDLKGDFNADRKVDNKDMANLAGGWKTDDECLMIANSSDGTVDLDDLLVFAANWLENAIPEIAIDEDFETGDLSKYPWTFEEEPWTVTTDDVYEGTFCAKSADIRSGSVDSILKITLNVEAGDISFIAKPSQFPGTLYFSIDDGVFVDITEDNSDWGRHSYHVSAGEHTFIWKFNSYDWRYISARLDNISFPPLKE